MKIWFSVLVLFFLAGAAIVGYKMLSEKQSPVTPETENTLSSARPGKQTLHLDVDGIDREFIVYMPENIQADASVPVVFMFHGGGGHAANLYRESGWVELANQEGFIVVFPQGLKYRLYDEDKVDGGEVVEVYQEYQTRWGTFHLESTFDPAYPDQVPADDVGFVRKIADYVKSEYPVDEDRFYANGFSNGGSFVSRLMTDATDIFAAFAINSSGGFTADRAVDQGYVPVEGFVARPMFHMIGSIDPKLVYILDVEEFSTGEDAMDVGNPVRESIVNGNLQLLGVDDAYTFDRDGRFSHFSFENASSGSNAEYQLYIVDGMKHVYPNGQNAPFMAVDYVWPFFEPHSR